MNFHQVSFGRVLGTVLLGTCVLLLSHCGKQAGEKGASDKPPVGNALIVPAQGAYTGAYIDFGDTEDNVTLEGIEDFEADAGKHQAIIAFSSFWGEGKFPTNQTAVVVAHHSVPLIFWSPWDYPYKETTGPDRFSLSNVLAGNWNAYIDSWADAAKAVRQPIFVSLCNEMNGDWFPWSGYFYGGGKVIPGSEPVLREGPEFFKRAYRYIVDRARARGATNILWVFHVNNFPEPYEPWNSYAAYYPGKDYVDWLGISAYGSMFPNSKWDEFEDMIDKPYEELAAVDPDKPMMVTEWGVGEFPGKGDKAEWFKEAFEDLMTQYPQFKAAIYWHERWQNSKTQLYSNLRINSSPAAQAAFRKGLANPYWLDYPKYK